MGGCAPFWPISTIIAAIGGSVAVGAAMYFGNLFDVIGQAIYAIWMSAGFIIGIFEDIFMVFAGVDHLPPDYNAGNYEPVDLPTRVITDGTVQTIFFSMMAVATVLLVFFTILKLVQNQYKERDGGNPYTTVFRMVKGMTMFLFITAGVIVGLQVSGIVLTALRTATSGARDPSLVGMVFNAKAVNSHRLERPRPGGATQDFHTERIALLLGDSSHPYHMRIVEIGAEASPNSELGFIRVYLPETARSIGIIPFETGIETAEVRLQRTDRYRTVQDSYVTHEFRLVQEGSVWDPGQGIYVPNMVLRPFHYDSGNIPAGPAQRVSSAPAMEIARFGDDFREPRMTHVYAANSHPQRDQYQQSIGTARHRPADELAQILFGAMYTYRPIDSFGDVEPVERVRPTLNSVRDATRLAERIYANQYNYLTGEYSWFWVPLTNQRRDGGREAQPPPFSPQYGVSSNGYTTRTTYTRTHIYHLMVWDHRIIMPWLAPAFANTEGAFDSAWANLALQSERRVEDTNLHSSRYPDSYRLASYARIQSGGAFDGDTDNEQARDALATRAWSHGEFISRRPQYRAFISTNDNHDIDARNNRMIGNVHWTNPRAVAYFYYFLPMNWIIGWLGLFILFGVLTNFLFGLIQRVAELAVLYMMSPITIALYPFDDGNAFSSLFVRPFYRKTIAIFAPVISLNLFFVLLPLFNSIRFFPQGQIVHNGIANVTVIIALFAMLPAIRTQVNTMFGADTINEKGIRQTFKESMAATVQPVGNTIKGGFEKGKKVANWAGDKTTAIRAKRKEHKTLVWDQEQRVIEDFAKGGMDVMRQRDGRLTDRNGNDLSKEDQKKVREGMAKAVANSTDIQATKNPAMQAMFGYGTEFEKKTRRFRQQFTGHGRLQKEKEFLEASTKAREENTELKREARGERDKTMARVTVEDLRAQEQEELIAKTKDARDAVYAKVKDKNLVASIKTYLAEGDNEKAELEMIEAGLEDDGDRKTLLNSGKTISEAEERKKTSLKTSHNEAAVLGLSEQQRVAGVAKFKATLDKEGMKEIEENLRGKFKAEGKIKDGKFVDDEAQIAFQEQFADRKAKYIEDKRRKGSPAAKEFDDWVEANTNKNQVWYRDQMPKMAERTYSDVALGISFEVAKEMRRVFDQANEVVSRSITTDPGFLMMSQQLGSSVEAMKKLNEYFQTTDANRRKEMEIQYSIGSQIQALKDGGGKNLVDAIDFTSSFENILGSGSSGIERGDSSEAGRNIARKMTEMMLDQLNIKALNVGVGIEADAEQQQYEAMRGAVNSATEAAVQAESAARAVQAALKDGKLKNDSAEEIARVLGAKDAVNYEMYRRGINDEYVAEMVRKGNAYEGDAMNEYRKIIEDINLSHGKYVDGMSEAQKTLHSSYLSNVSTFQSAYQMANEKSNELNKLLGVIQSLERRYAFEKGFIHGKPLDEYRG